MYHSSPRRGIRAVALAFLTLTATLAVLGCGKDGGSGPTDPGPSDPGPSDQEPVGWPGPAPVGHVMYAVDLSNNFLVFGSESFDALTAKMRIEGLPILKRIIGIALRPSNGKLYGVGNDSRVYTIDPLTAVATPVSSGPFSPKIASAFDIHFAMDLEPKGDRVRLIAAESGGNWSISLDDGTAILEENARYGPGTPLEGKTPRLLGIAFAPPADTADASLCQNLAYGVDADEAIMVASCDPATGLWWPTVSEGPSQSSLSYGRTGELPRPTFATAPRAFEELKDQLLRCGEMMFEPGGPIGPSSGPGETPPPDGGTWGPRTPPSQFTTFLVRAGRNTIARLEYLGVDVGVTITEYGDIVSKEPIQSVEWVHPKYVPHPVPQQLRRQVPQDVQLSAEVQEPEPSSPPAPPTDPRARCS
jgi:Domain of unknown function (DUF4394)